MKEYAFVTLFYKNTNGMTATDKRKTAEALVERTVWTHIGILPIRFRPLTLGQIYEMGEYIDGMEGEGLEPDKKVNVAAEMLARYKSAPLMQETYLIAAYRSRWARKLFRRYILKRLTIRKFQKAQEVITNSYGANFFLTSIIFLHKTKPMTEPKPTTALGPQSEE